MEDSTDIRLLIKEISDVKKQDGYFRVKYKLVPCIMHIQGFMDTYNIYLFPVNSNDKICMVAGMMVQYNFKASKELVEFLKNLEI